MWVTWSSVAFGWSHLEFVQVAPFTLEVTTSAPGDLPPGSLHEALAAAVDLWTDDACAAPPEITVVETADNLSDPDDGRSTVSVDPDEPYEAVLYLQLGGETAFRRFGVDYEIPDDQDLVFSDLPFATDGEVVAGTCDGPGLSWLATEMVGFLLGVAPPDGAVDSLFNQPECSLPSLSADDRASLRALYGSGVTAECLVVPVTWLVYPGDVLPFDLCTVTPFGPSPVLDQWLAAPDGTRVELAEPTSLDVPGEYTFELCADVEAPAGCDEPVSCGPWPDTYRVCAEPEVALDAALDPAWGELHLTDLTQVEPDCDHFLDPTWRVTDGAGAPVASGEGDSWVVSLPEYGTYEVELSLAERFTATTTVTWEEAPEPTFEPRGADEEGGCGCAHPSRPAGALLIAAVVAAARRRR